MKAYELTIKDDDDQGTEIVFAENGREAKKQIGTTELKYDRYTDVRVKRYPEFDGMENASHYQMTRKKWQLGWWFDSFDPVPSEEAGVKAFREWYLANYGMYKEKEDE